MPLSAAVLLACLAPAQPPPAGPPPLMIRAPGPPAVSVERAAMDEFTFTTVGVLFNNSQLVEQPVPPRPGRPQMPAHELALHGTFRNRTPGLFDFALVVVGVDAGGEPLWACAVAGRAGPNSVGVVEAAVPVPEGTFAQTATVRFRARNAGPVIFHFSAHLFGGN